MAHDTTLYRLDDAYIGGVCSGIADRLDLDPIVVRILAVLITAVTFGIGAIAYVVAWIALPKREKPLRAPLDVIPESAESSSFGSLDAWGSWVESGQADEGRKRRGGVPVAVRVGVLVALALLFMCVAAGAPPLLQGTHWWQFWPTAPLIVGICLIVVPIPSKNEVLWHVLGVIITSLAAIVMPMSLDILAWSTLADAFANMWFLVVLAAVLLAFGIWKNKVLLLVAGATCVVVFCACAVIFFSVPGAAESLMLVMPGGHVFVVSPL